MTTSVAPRYRRLLQVGPAVLALAVFALGCVAGTAVAGPRKESV